MAKAYYESRHYMQAAITRKACAAKKREAELGRPLSVKEYNDLVWNSNGVQKRTMREDYIRYHPEHYSDPTDTPWRDLLTWRDSTPGRNCWARFFSRTAHVAHGFCESFAAPTGMTMNLARGLTTGKLPDESTRNKTFMLGTLGFIGVANSELAEVMTAGINVAGGALTASSLTAFSAFSATMGGIGTGAGLVSQALITEQDFTEKEIAAETKHLNSNLLKLVTILKSVKHKPELIRRVAKGMQGRRVLLKKIGKEGLDSNGTPLLLLKALDAIKLNASDTDNMNALFDAVGEYLQVPNQAEGKDTSRWSKYVQAKKIKAQERHWVSMLGLVEHQAIEDPPTQVVDGRKLTENAAEQAHEKISSTLTPVAKVFDSYFGTRLSAKLEKSTSPAYQAMKKAEKENPANAAKYAFTGTYMLKNRHQFGPITRCFITLSEAVRVFNLGVVLSSNGNLSRICNNVLFMLNEWVGTSPASRTMCNSAGRFFGGAILAIALAFIPSFGDIDFGVNGPEEVTISPKSIGILMCIVAAPTLAFQGLAILVGKLEGWKGDIKPTLNSGDTKAFTW